jgi:predicted CoA-binding protein
MKPIKVGKPGKRLPVQDRAHDVLRTEGHPLDAIFAPHSVAVIGASERQGSVGRAVLWSLVSSPFGGTVYPVSEKNASVLGIKAYRTVDDIPETVDLAVIVTPADTVPGDNALRQAFAAQSSSQLVSKSAATTARNWSAKSSTSCARATCG